MYQEQKFNIPELKGISAKNIEEHLKLYAGYVKHTNLILEKIKELEGNEKDAYALAEMQRRFSFEWNGMRNHEYYFKSLEDGAKILPAESRLKKAIEAEWGAPEALPSGSFDKWLNRFKTVALTRGIGWAILYYDPIAKKLLNAWIDEQHVGQLNSLQFVLGIDMWEHAFIYDYPTSEKKKYVETFFANLNWEVIEKNFVGALK
ncbi:MAG TPA: Fe-Mn family superoxide dismutase [Candidatus Paceibacterota bacterium]|nr:Fe-Mn family superoxide dismutase [Candidatus Paceibacterota bacterium]